MSLPPPSRHRIRAQESPVAQVCEAYEALGTDYPRFENLSVFRGLYKRLAENSDETRILQRHELKGWLHYEHALALQNRYPVRAQAQFDQAATCFSYLSDIYAPKNPTQSIQFAMRSNLLTIGRERLGLNPPKRSHDIGIVSGLMRDCIERKDLDIGFVRGQLAELAFAAIGLLRFGGVPLPATRRQEGPQAGEASYSSAIDLNFITMEQTETFPIVVRVIPTQIKNKPLDEKLRSRPGYDSLPPSNRHIYAPDIALLHAETLLGTRDICDYQYFVGHLQDYVEQSIRSPYLQEAETNVCRVLERT